MHPPTRCTSRTERALGAIRANIRHPAMPDELAELMDDLARARDTEAAARMDVRDRQADETEATQKRMRAEVRLTSCIEQTRRVRAALNDWHDWVSTPALEQVEDAMALKLIEGKRK